MHTPNFTTVVVVLAIWAIIFSIAGAGYYFLKVRPEKRKRRAEAARIEAKLKIIRDFAPSSSRDYVRRNFQFGKNSPDKLATIMWLLQAAMAGTKQTWQGLLSTAGQAGLSPEEFPYYFGLTSSLLVGSHQLSVRGGKLLLFESSSSENLLISWDPIGSCHSDDLTFISSAVQTIVRALNNMDGEVLQYIDIRDEMAWWTLDSRLRAQLETVTSPK